jgi:phage-related protein
MHKNRVILNGVRSDLIDGLLIQELPPIKKPQMRTQIEEIDGRDGSIVTYLGYSAYDKEMIIGLYGDYDIDQVIRFFNSEGTVVFSNEPDKVYKYRIINAIDFVRLARFKTATVTFYVQPFKHSAVEAEQTFSTSPCTVINSGNIASKPVITLTGSGTVTLYLNSDEVLVISLGSTQRSIIIDAEAMEAYWGDTLLNRLVAGDYGNLTFPVGKNRLSWAGGSVTSFTIDKYSRWI